VNVVAELERRLIGTAPSPGLRDGLASCIPDAASYVLVMIDGLGAHQMGHPAAGPLAASRCGVIDASFPTTTTVSLATMATGVPPARHGLLGYQLWLPETGHVVGTIKWTTLWGEPIPYDYDGFLPSPTTWERLTAGGAEAIAVQPAGFEGSPLTRVLYRGARFEGYHDMADSVNAAVSMAGTPGRLIVLYVPQVDFAAHVAGQQSEMYSEAMTTAATVYCRRRGGRPRACGHPPGAPDGDPQGRSHRPQVRRRRQGGLRPRRWERTRRPASGHLDAQIRDGALVGPGGTAPSVR